MGPPRPTRAPSLASREEARFERGVWGGNPCRMGFWGLGARAGGQEYLSALPRVVAAASFHAGALLTLHSGTW